jgi:hypothetical protein
MPISLCRYCCAIMAFVLTGAAATASPAAPADRLADYSHRLPLRTVSSQAIVRLPLPRAVYLNARSSALHDLRVFDAVGASMSFALVDQAPPAVEKKANAPVAISHCMVPPVTQGRCLKACRSVPGATAPSSR